LLFLRLEALWLARSNRGHYFLVVGGSMGVEFLFGLGLRLLLQVGEIAESNTCLEKKILHLIWS